MLDNEQKQILTLAAKGLSAKSISRIVNLSPKAIEHYRTDIYKALGAKNSAHAVAIAIKHELIDFEHELPHN